MLLFTPGPTPVLEEIRMGMAIPTIHHRTPEFESIFKRARELLLKLLKTDEVVIFASSGTGAMESAITNLTLSKVLVINGGKFGERFGKIANSHNIPYRELVYEWNTPASADEVVEEIENDKTIDSIAIQISESSGGVRHPVEEIAKRVKEINPDITIIADGITAIGVEPIDVSNIDVLIGGSQKAFMLPPGLSFLGLSNRAIKKMDNGKGFYFNIPSEIKKQRQGTTAYTPATTLIIGLVQILEKIEEFRIENLYQKTAKRHQAIIRALQTIGLEIYSKSPSLAMVTIFSENSSEIRKLLKTKFGVHLAGGQEKLKNSIFRINNMGLIEDYEISWVVNSIEMTLDILNIRPFDGTANRVFFKEMLS